MPDRPPSTCLIVLSDSLYLPGTLKLIDTFRSHNQSTPLIAISDDSAALNDSRLTERADKTILIDPIHYADIRPYKKRHSQRHGRTFYKFEAFADYGYDRNIFLDSDMLCLGPTPKLFEPSHAPLLAARDTGFKKTRGYKGSPNEINSGVLVIHKSLQGPSTIERLKQIARDNPGRGGYNSGDQGIINKWIRLQQIEIELLPPEYNLIKKDYSDTEGLETCRLLHYCDRKPWIQRNPNDDAIPSPLEQLWHRPEER